MRTVLQILCVASLIVGLLATLLGVFALVYARLAPIQPTPSLNEGAGLAGYLGLLTTILGVVSLLVALAALAGVRSLAKPDRDWARAHKRLW